MRLRHVGYMAGKKGFSFQQQWRDHRMVRTPGWG
jgi:hypothetical protein